MMDARTDSGDVVFGVNDGMVTIKRMVHVI